MKIFGYYIVSEAEVDKVHGLLEELRKHYLDMREQRGEQYDQKKWLQHVIEKNPELIANTEWPKRGQAGGAGLTAKTARLTKDAVYDEGLEILR